MQIAILIAIICAYGNVQAQKLDNFGSSIEKKIGLKTVRVSYTDVVTYLGHATAGNEDEVKDGKNSITFMYGFLQLLLS